MFWRRITSSFFSLLVLLQGEAQGVLSLKSQSAPEEFSLLKFKGNIVMDPFQALTDWTLDNPLCNWTGIACNRDYHVIHLNLQNKLLTGPISSEIAKLKHLQYLNLQNNSFIGQIPPGLGGLCHLLELRLGLNPLSGSIPDDLWSMQVVSQIHIFGTNISGNLSPCIQALRNISFLCLNDNQLAGSIPFEVGTLQSLQKLDIHGNSFSGSFPMEIFDLPLISKLDISNNHFSGIVPAEKPGLNFSYTNNELLSACTSCRIRVLVDTPSSAPPGMKIAGSCSLAAIGLIAGILVALALFLALGGLLYFCRISCLKRHNMNHAKLLEKGDENRTWALYTRRFSLDQLRRATKNFSPDHIIGSGGFGLVYKAVLDTCEVVAIKRSREESCQGVEVFHNEVKLLSKIHHKHLVNLVGYCEDNGEQMLVYEYVPNGSLLEHILGEKGFSLTWRQRVQIAIGSAKGIAYLHDGCNPAIIHRDIKPSNILLDHDYGPKVSDFGLSRAGPAENASHISTQVKGTPGYLDPHYCLSFHLSLSSDVYSFGVILLQLVTAKAAIDHSRRRSHYHIINWARENVEQGHLENILDPRLLGRPYNRQILLDMSRLGLRCVDKNMKERPTMSTVGQELEASVRKTELAMFKRLAMPSQFREVRTGSAGLMSQKDAREATKLDSNSFSDRNAASQKRSERQQAVMDKPIRERAIELRISSYKGTPEALTTEESTDFSLETFHRGA